MKSPWRPRPRAVHCRRPPPPPPPMQTRYEEGAAELDEPRTISRRSRSRVCGGSCEHAPARLNLEEPPPSVAADPVGQTSRRACASAARRENASSAATAEAAASCRPTLAGFIRAVPIAAVRAVRPRVPEFRHIVLVWLLRRRRARRSHCARAAHPLPPAEQCDDRGPSNAIRLPVDVLVDGWRHAGSATSSSGPPSSRPCARAGGAKIQTGAHGRHGHLRLRAGGRRRRAGAAAGRRGLGVRRAPEPCSCRTKRQVGDAEARKRHELNYKESREPTSRKDHGLRDSAASCWRAWASWG